MASWTNDDRSPERWGNDESSIIPFNVCVPVVDVGRKDPLDPCSRPRIETGVSKAKSGLDFCLPS